MSRFEILAATRHGDALREAAETGAAGPDLLEALASLLGEAPEPSGEARPPAPPRSAPRSRAARRSPRPRASPPRRGGSS